MMFSCCHPRLPRGRAGRAGASTSCAASASSEIAAAFLTSRSRDGEAHLARQEGARQRQAAVRSRRTPTSQRACQPSSARCICSSTRAITAPRRNRRCAPSCAASHPPDDAAARASAHGARRPRTRSPRSCACTPRGCPARLDCRREPELALRSGSIAVGCTPHCRRVVALLESAATGIELTRVSRRGSDRRGSCERIARRRHGLAPIVALYDTSDGHPAVAGRRAQSRHRRRAERGCGARSRGDSCHRRRRAPGGLSFLLRGARRARASLQPAALARATLSGRAGAGPQPDGTTVPAAAARRVCIIRYVAQFAGDPAPGAKPPVKRRFVV